MWSFRARLRERKLAHWAIAYLAGAWLPLQVLSLNTGRNYTAHCDEGVE